ncbi:nickel-responsive transcriptional regulator NikR [Pelagicoccus sp. SDUM812005]|uniref:nickel-responsive transcriptional regulator NikR n=1 Tax=Pelagicoccus sp. SDUM812005 TaxID=3041257 RepID=UPI00280E9115|nr:nickel-responsive transcriptional regulator NikR [Pelagicoccus sp. SDUM812005]MDQ8180567.1 nickel-responsive transcriptional regulator NikR [Pelagicoccus sp. SDUM812005]
MPKKETTERISMTLPQSTLKQLDSMVESRGYANRSQGITEIINRELVKHNQRYDDTVMAGTITLFYAQTRNNLAGRLAQIQRDHVAEVISSLHVQLENNHTMEVILVQGPASKLRIIADELITCKGVKNGSLNLSTTILPPLHQNK